MVTNCHTPIRNLNTTKSDHSDMRAICTCGKTVAENTTCSCGNEIFWMAGAGFYASDSNGKLIPLE